MAKKKNPHIRRSLDEFIGEQRAKDPEFRAEFDRLQLARKVKGLREKKKMSQVQLAVLAGTKQPNIARLESGKVVPRLDFLEKVARARDGQPAARGRMQEPCCPAFAPDRVKSSGLASSSVGLHLTG